MPRPDLQEFIALSEQLFEAVKPLLAGKDPDVQGAALGDVVAIWLAGHSVEDNPEDTRKLREELLDLHVETVRRLIYVNSDMLGTVVTHEDYKR